MRSFLEFLDERQLMLGGKYSKYGNALILAGGAASGKGFSLSNVIGFKGRIFDVDEVKKQVVKYSKLNPDSVWATKFKEKYGYELSDYNPKSGKHVEDLHNFIEDNNIADNIKDNFIKSMQGRDHKENLDNIIFDVTLKTTKKLENISASLDTMGYKLQNRHIVWIVTPTEEAVKNNLSRERSIKNETLFETHDGAAKTMLEIISNSSYRTMIDGDIWIVFNSRNLKDTVFDKVLKEYSKFKVKAAGQPAVPLSTIADKYLDKIRQYVPSGTGW